MNEGSTHESAMTPMWRARAAVLWPALLGLVPISRGFFFPMPLFIAIPTAIAVLAIGIHGYRKGTLTPAIAVLALLAGAVSLAIPWFVQTALTWMW